MRRCHICHQSKTFEGFYRSKVPGAGGYDYACKLCRKERQNQYRRKNKEKVNENNRKWREKNPLKNLAFIIKHRYGMTFEQYMDIFNRQEGRCQICESGDHKLVVDHCHKTKKIRGLLCRNCNSGIGYFQDRPELMKRGAQYIIDSVDQ